MRTIGLEPKESHGYILSGRLEVGRMVPCVRISEYYPGRWRLYPGGTE